MYPIKNITTKAADYCKSVGLLPGRVQTAVNSGEVTMYRLTSKSEMRLYDVDYSYPYVILDRFNRPVTLK